MANKYSKYELKPFTSTYVDPKWAEAATNYKATYDKNVARKDEIDQALGGLETLSGDAHIVEKAKNDVRGKLSEIVKSGAYEDAGSIISETMNDLHGNAGIKASQKSYKNRQEELDFLKKARMEGKTILDFGASDASTHSSYALNPETGKYEENIYEASSQPQLHYDEKMQSLFKGLKSNSWGIDASDISRTVNSMLPAYLISDEGKQDVKRLMELEYDQSIPASVRLEMARKDIKERMLGIASVHKHTLETKVSSSDRAKQEKWQAEQDKLYKSMIGEGDFMSTNATSINLNTEANPNDIAQSVLSDAVNGAIADVDNVISGNTQGLKDSKEQRRRVLDNLLSTEAATPKQVEEYKFYNNEMFRDLEVNEGFTEKKAVALKMAIKYMSTNSNLADFTMSDPYFQNATDDLMTTLSLGAVPTAALGATGKVASWVSGIPGASSLVFGLAKGLAVGTAGAGYAYAAGASAIDSRGNVRDILAPQTSNQFASKYLGVDSEQAQLAKNLADIDWLNRTLKLEGDDMFTKEDVHAMKRVGAGYLTYMQENGDTFDEILNENGGGAVDYDVIAPDVFTDEGSKAMTRINNILKTTTLSNFRVIGAPEESPEYNDLSKDGHNIAGYRYKGEVAASLRYDTPLRLSFYREGTNKYAAKEFLAETKTVYGQDSRGKKEIATAIAAASGRLDYVVLADVQKKLQGQTDITMAAATSSIGESISTVSEQVGMDPSLRMNVWKETVRNVILEHPDARKVLNTLSSNLLEVFSGEPAYASAAKSGTPLKVTDLTEEDQKMYYSHIDSRMYGELNEKTGQFEGGIAQSTKYLIR